MKNLFFLVFLLLITSSYAQQTWQTHTQTADSLELNFNFEESLLKREKAIKAVTVKDKDTLPFLKTLKDIAYQEVEISNTEKKKKSYTKLKKNIQKLEELGAKPERMFQAYRRLYIFAHNYLRNMEETNFYISKSIDAHFKCEKIDSVVMLKTMHSLGVISRELGMFDNAINTFSEAETFYKSQKMKDTNMLGSIYVDVANTYSSKFLNLPSKREFFLKEAEAVFLEIENPNMDYLVAIYPMLSDVEKEFGNYDDAISYLNKGLSLYLKNKAASQSSRMGKIGFKRELQFHHFLVDIYSKKGEEKMMLSHLQQMLALTKGEKLDAIETDFISLAYLFITRYYIKIEDYKIALTYINKGLKLNSKSHEENLEPDFLLEKAKIYTQTENYSKAETVFNKVESFLNNPAFITNDLLISKTLLYISQNKEEQAFENINKSLKWISRSSDTIDIKTINYDSFKPSPVLKDANRILKIADKLNASKIPATKETKMLYWLALKQFKENFSNQILNDELNKTFSKISSFFFDLVSQNELTNEEEQRFFSFIELVEAKYLFKSFLDNRTIVFTPQQDSILVKEELLRSKITYLKQKLLSNKEDSLKIRQQLFNETRSLQSVISQKNNLDNSMVQLLNEKAYRNNIEHFKNTNIVKFKIADEFLYRIVYFNQSVSVSNLGNVSDIKKSVQHYVMMLKNSKVPIAEIKEKGGELYAVLLKGLEVETFKKMYIIPDGFLNYLPFELLTYHNNYLLESTEISYAVAVSLLKSPVDDLKSSTKKIALFAPSYNRFKPNDDQLAVRGEPYFLHGAIKEVDLISSIFESTVFKEDRATKKMFKNLTEDYSVIHLSMHSFLNDKDSELSSLVFSDKDTDYQLYISELYGLHFNTNLVVLSACNTGIGNYETGKGIISLQTAFTAAGVPSVLSSLWSAPDKATQEIMVSFYKNLKKGLSKSRSLQLAKLDYLENTSETALKHPYFWAGFIVSGDVSPIQNSTPLNNKIWLVSGVLLLGLVGLGLYFRKKKQAA